MKGSGTALAPGADWERLILARTAYKRPRGGEVGLLARAARCGADSGIPLEFPRGDEYFPETTRSQLARAWDDGLLPRSPAFFANSLTGSALSGHISGSESHLP